jgi:3-keto-disaccharide hydrolase
MNPRIALFIFLAMCLTGCGVQPPAGYTSLFNGRNLNNWQGLVEPPARAKLSPADLATTQAAADQRMRDHWRIKDHTLIFDGKGESLCTIEPFGDFQLLVDWKIEKDGDSGIYLRGTPQVQIWDNPIGSGGLYNNEKNPSKPIAVADRPVGEWNTFDITMIGDRVTVLLNGTPVTDNTPLENYWDRAKPLPARGPIELQSHGSTLYFRNIFIRRLESATEHKTN